MEMQRIIGAQILSLASLVRQDYAAFNSLHASHPSEHTILHDG
jgi:hypothetical protein